MSRLNLILRVNYDAMSPTIWRQWQLQYTPRIYFLVGTYTNCKKYIIRRQTKEQASPKGRTALQGLPPAQKQQKKNPVSSSSMF